MIEVIRAYIAFDGTSHEMAMDMSEAIRQFVLDEPPFDLDALFAGWDARSRAFEEETELRLRHERDTQTVVDISYAVRAAQKASLPRKSLCDCVGQCLGHQQSPESKDNIHGQLQW